jgi:hypothetical protein
MSTKPPAPPAKRSGTSPLVIVAVLALVVGAGALALWQNNSAPQAAATTAQKNPVAAPADVAQQAPAPPQTAISAPITPEAEAVAAAQAALGPHPQSNLPPVPFRGYAPPRAPEVVTAAYAFAAEHPEVLTYVPCFCGCEHGGHKGNEDCYVKSRTKNGDVIEWEEHGLECAVCIDVATRARQMHSSGASVRDIRAAVEKEFAPLALSKTPTPMPPGHVH